MNERQSDSTLRGSLRHQIRVTARQLAERKQAVRLHRAALGERLHAGLTSPGMLLLAGSAGFVIAEFAARPGSAQDSEGRGESRRLSMAGARRAFRVALGIYSLAHAASSAMATEPHHSDDWTSPPFT